MGRDKIGFSCLSTGSAQAAVSLLAGSYRPEASDRRIGRPPQHHSPVPPPWRFQKKKDLRVLVRFFGSEKFKATSFNLIVSIFPMMGLVNYFGIGDASYMR